MPKGYNHLTNIQRCQIYSLKSIGKNQKEIAKHLCVSPSTISRELNRNKSVGDDFCDGYHPILSNIMAKARKSRASQNARSITTDIMMLVEKKLKMQWSPEQISGRLGLKGVKISHETIYSYVWKNKRKGGNLYLNLRRNGKKYRRRNGKPKRSLIPNRVDISERPSIVDSKSRVGDWEGDTIIGKAKSHALLTLVDRKSKYLIMEKLARKTSINVVNAVIKRCSKHVGKIKTMTFDNGSEFCGHLELSKPLGAKCYFARPYHAWERGLNEHTNGLVRQYIPKGTDISNLSNDEINSIENNLNNRPRKVLGYMTPREIFLSSG